GSLLRGAQAAVRDARRGTPPPPLFVRPRGGPATLSDELAARLGPNLRLHTRVETLAASDDGWVLHTSAGPLHAEAVVVAIDAPAARRLLEPVAGGVGDGLEQVPNVSVGVVVLVYPEGTAEAVPAGAGFAAPAGTAP